MLRYKSFNGLIKRESPEPHEVVGQPLRGENVECLTNCRIAATDGDHARTGTGPALNNRRGNEACRFFVLAQKPVHNFLIFVRHFGIAAELVMAGSACEERA